MTGVGYSLEWGDVLVAWRYLDYEMAAGTPIKEMNFDGPAVAVAFHW
jgi:hypothetical protein